MSYTAITYGDSREAALYFDNIVPIGFVYDLALELGYDPHNIDPTTKMMAIDPPIKLETIREMARNYAGMLHPKLKYIDRLSDEYEILIRLAIFDALAARNHRVANTSFVEYIGHELRSVMQDSEDIFYFTIPPNIADLDDRPESHNVAWTLKCLNLVDVSNLSWKQVVEFRNDKDAVAKLRRLRLFAEQNYVGKSKSYIEDDISMKIYDYERASKKWGFDTKIAGFSMILNSKPIGVASAAALASTLFGEPVAGLLALGGGVAVEAGKLAIEVSKRRFDRRHDLDGQAVSYIIDARENLVPNK